MTGVMFIVGDPPLLEIHGPAAWPAVGEWWLTIADEHAHETARVPWSRIVETVGRIVEMCEGVPEVRVWGDPERGSYRQPLEVWVRYRGGHADELAQTCAEIVRAIEQAIDARIETRIREAT